MKRLRKPVPPLKPCMPVEVTKRTKEIARWYEYENPSVEEIVSRSNGTGYLEIDSDYFTFNIVLYSKEQTTNPSYEKDMIKYVAQLEQYDKLQAKFMKDNAAYLAQQQEIELAKARKIIADHEKKKNKNG